MGLEKTVQPDAGQSRHLAQLWFGDAAGPELFNREGFKRAALQFVMYGLTAEVGGQFVRKLEGELNNSTLPWRPSAVKLGTLVQKFDDRDAYPRLTPRGQAKAHVQGRRFRLPAL